MPAACNVIKNAPTKINFLATVKIPVGYRLVSPPEYNIYLTMDSSNLKTDKVLELKDSTIILEQDDLGNPTKTITCSSEVARVLVHGTIYYNLVISKFQTGQALDTLSVSAFTTNDVIPVDVTLGYACAQCPFPEESLYGFKVELTKLTEFITANNGSQIFYNPSDPDAFYNALADINDTEIISVPYTITITPVVPGE